MASNQKIGRNNLCACGSGKKFKHCCALKSSRQASATLNPQLDIQISALLDRAIDHQNASQLGEAEAIYRQILRVDPNNADANHLLGLLGHQIGKHKEAIVLMNKAIELKPNFAEAHCNLGLAKQALGRMDEAREHFKKAIAIDSSLVMAHNNYGNLLCKADKNYAEAMRCFNKVIALDPTFILAYFNLGNTLVTLKQYAKAVTIFQQAVLIAPQSDLAHYNLAKVLLDVWRVDEAIQHYKQALLINPNNTKPLQEMLMVLQYSANVMESELQQACAAFALRHETDFQAQWTGYGNSLNNERLLKIGYISPDLRVHPVTNFIEPVLANHDHTQFEVSVYYCNEVQDNATERLKAYVDHWFDCPLLSDEDLAKRIRDDEIDILVDLSGHTLGNRLLTFVRKPAPIQVSWMGYVGSTGLTSIDYRLTDAVAEPSGAQSSVTPEQPFMLNPIWYVYRPSIKNPTLRNTDALRVNPLPALYNGFITFGSLNNVAKITLPVIALWARVLQSTPNAVLALVSKEDVFLQSEILAAFLLHGISQTRIRFLSFSEENHYLLYHQIDIALDPFPYNGGTTSCDCVWMGVPFITLAGQVFRSRMGTTIANSIGHLEWVAKSEEDYVNIAVALSKDFNQLNQLRLGLRAQMEQSCLMDEAGFTKKLEAAYRTMWADYIKEKAI